MMASGVAAAGREESEGVIESSSPLLVCPQWPPDLQGLKPDGADSIAARGKENPKSTDSALPRAVEAEVGAAVTSSDVLIQVLPCCLHEC